MRKAGTRCNKRAGWKNLLNHGVLKKLKSVKTLLRYFDNKAG